MSNTKTALALDATGAELMVRMLQSRTKRNQRSLVDAARSIAAAATQLADAVERGAWSSALAEWRLSQCCFTDIERSGAEVTCAGDLLLLVHGALPTSAAPSTSVPAKTAASSERWGSSGMTQPSAKPRRRPTRSPIVVTWSPAAQSEARAIQSHMGIVPPIKKGNEP